MSQSKNMGKNVIDVILFGQNEWLNLGRNLSCLDMMAPLITSIRRCNCGSDIYNNKGIMT